MYKFRLLSISLFTLVCLITPFVASKLLAAATTTPASGTPLTVLPAQAFITAVNDSNSQVQSGLCTTLAQILKLKDTSPPGCSSTPNTALSADTTTSTDTSSQSEVQSSPTNNSTTTAPAKNPQLNLYSN